MPNRIIKESIKRSPEIDRLSWFEEVVFYRILVTADDYGRLDGRAVVLRNDLFPTKETITKKAIEDAVSKLVSVGLLVTYVDPESNMPLLAIRKWDKHQIIRNKYSRYPAPPDDLLANCKQLPADCKQAFENCPYESESNKNPNPIRNSERKRFTPPTLDEVSAYCKERGNKVDPQKWWDFYASKGWKVGNNPMKDWQASVRTWEREDNSKRSPAKADPRAAQNYSQRTYSNDLVDLYNDSEVM